MGANHAGAAFQEIMSVPCASIVTEVQSTFMPAHSQLATLLLCSQYSTLLFLNPHRLVGGNRYETNYVRG